MALVRRQNDMAVDRPWSAVDRFFDDMWQDPFRRFFRAPSLFELSDSELLHWHPTADIHETDNEFIVQMDLPGITKKDVKVSIDDNVLTIRGERNRETTEDYRVQERYYGKFERSFVLPRNVDSNSVDAEFKDGVLTVHIQKQEASRAKQIKIR